MCNLDIRVGRLFLLSFIGEYVFEILKKADQRQGIGREGVLLNTHIIYFDWHFWRVGYYTMCGSRGGDRGSAPTP